MAVGYTNHSGSSGFSDEFSQSVSIAALDISYSFKTPLDWTKKLYAVIGYTFGPFEKRKFNV